MHIALITSLEDGYNPTKIFLVTSKNLSNQFDARARAAGHSDRTPP